MTLARTWLGWLAAAALLSTPVACPQQTTDVAPIDWIRSNAVPLRTVEPGRGFDDMRPLAKVVGNARIVALGEATHGTHEFFLLKHRVLEFLATERGFTIFAMEASMPEANRLNDFVLNGTGDPKQLLQGLHYAIWNTEEVLGMVLWMREFNRSGQGRIAFMGFDMQNPKLAMETVGSFVAEHDNRLKATLDPIYEDITQATKQKWLDSPSPSQQLATHLLAVKCRGIFEHLQQDRERFLQSHIDASEVDWAIQNARIVLQYALLRSGEQSRDQSMAANIEWIAQHNPGAKIVIWAHNGHVKYSNPPGFDPMGGYLRAKFRRELVNFGFAFGQGSFRAMEAGRNQLREFTVQPLAMGSLDGTLATANIPILALDLRELPKGPVANWFARPRAMRSIGAIYNENDPEAPMFVSHEVWPKDFDVILFVEKTTPSHGLD